MTAALFRLMWKEYRVLRSFWLALAVLGLCCDGLIFALQTNPQQRLPGLFGLAGALPVCFALGAGATLFAMEREESTRDFLRCLPITSSRIFASKVLLAIGGTLLITVVFLAIAMGGLWACATGTIWTRSAARDVGEAALIITVIVGQMMGWATFFSLKTARPLLAAVLGAVAALACMSLVLGLSEGGFARPLAIRPWSIPLGFVAVTAGVWLLDIWIGVNWLHGPATRARFWHRSASKPSLFNRLIWQEWRRSSRMLAVLLAVGIALPALMWPAFIPVTGLVFALLGACTFLGDQERQQYRFFAERSVSAHSVWLSRQVFWGGAALLLAFILFLTHRAGASLVTLADEGVRRMWLQLAWVFRPAGYASWILLAFGAGQLASMFLRSGLVAAVLGVILAGLLLAWAVLMHTLAISFWWSVAPLILALFAATWLRSTGWILERRNWRAWLPPALVLIIPTTSIVAFFPFYRVWEIPEAELSLASEAPSPPSAQVNEAARELVRAYEQMRFRAGQIQLAPLNDPADAEPSSDELRWLNENEIPLNAAIRALSQMPADATIAAATPRSPDDWHKFAAMFIRYGQLAERDGDLDEAWVRYRAVLRIARLLRHDSGVLGQTLGAFAEQVAASQLPRWGARQGQTADRLQTALDELRELNKHDQPLADVVRREYLATMALIDNVQRDPDKYGSYDPRMAVIARWAPWEFDRARRLARYVASLDLEDVRQADAALAGSDAVTGVLSRGAELAAARVLAQTTLLNTTDRSAELLISLRVRTLDYRRATQLALAAEAWRLEHGQLPENLMELEGPYFDKLPLDPYTNQPFAWFPWGLRVAVRSENVARVPGGTPLIVSQDYYRPFTLDMRDILEGFRRQSPHDPILRLDLSAGGMPGVGGGEPQSPMGIAAPGAAGGGSAPGPTVADEPTSPFPRIRKWTGGSARGPTLADDPAVSVAGLTFPIPDSADAPAK